MRVTARVEVNMRTKEIVQRGEGFCRDFADQLGELTAQIAKRNVEQGSGPGPHPHRPQSPHEDTGDLASSVQTRALAMGFMQTTLVFTDLEYGAHLEFGWTNPFSGNHWRYPWLMPAAEQARQEAMEIARSTARRWLSDEGGTYAGRVNVQAPLSGTAWPE